MKLINFNVTITLAILFVLHENVLAFNDIITHRQLTEKAVENSNVNKYLIEKLDIDKGINTSFPDNSNNTIKFLLMEGSKLEDEPVCRASNHFHNPLLSWDQSYMTDDILTDKGSFVRWKCDMTGWPYSERLSNVVWATKYRTPAPDGDKISINKQEMSWDEAREYYRLALTGSDRTERENNFAKTFQSLGQVMHLLEDMAVPAHTRNDFIIKETLI